MSTPQDSPFDEVVIETDRLLLKRWRVDHAAVAHRLWSERDPRVPPRRRIDAAGHPAIEHLKEWIRSNQQASVGLLAIERKTGPGVIGYCGLIVSDHGTDGEPELAFELLERAWGRGYATEAVLAVLDEARHCGHERLWASVREWNRASCHVLGKAGFTETNWVTPDAVHGNLLIYIKQL